MRHWWAILATLALAQCTSTEELRERRAEMGYVIIGLAENADGIEPRYSMLWRRVDGSNGFGREFNENAAFEARTNVNDTVRVRGIPGEFTMVEVPAGFYALDSVWGEILDGRLRYFANGIITGPERPGFEVRAGESVYLGIWQAELRETTAVASLWRLEEADLRAAIRASRDEAIPNTRLRETRLVSVPCNPRRVSSMTQRQIC